MRFKGFRWVLQDRGVWRKQTDRSKVFSLVNRGFLSATGLSLRLKAGEVVSQSMCDNEAPRTRDVVSTPNRKGKRTSRRRERGLTEGTDWRQRAVRVLNTPNGGGESYRGSLSPATSATLHQLRSTPRRIAEVHGEKQHAIRNCITFP
jgi:hypothetical protein